jgi:hypothetical protein
MQHIHHHLLVLIIILHDSILWWRVAIQTSLFGASGLAHSCQSMGLSSLSQRKNRSVEIRSLLKKHVLECNSGIWDRALSRHSCRVKFSNTNPNTLFRKKVSTLHNILSMFLVFYLVTWYSFVQNFNAHTKQRRVTEKKNYNWGNLSTWAPHNKP